MPSYEYKCHSCENLITVTHSIHDDPEIKCKACKGAMQRIMQGAYVAFKGAGFYSTDKND